METKNMKEDRIINNLIQQIRVGNFKDDNGHELINNDSYVDFINLWLNDTIKISDQKVLDIQKCRDELHKKFAKYESAYMNDGSMSNDLLDMAEGIIRSYRKLVKLLEG